MQDKYKNDIDRIQKLIVSIKTDLNKREQQKKLNQPTSMKEGEIRGALTILDRELTLLADIIKNSENTLLQKEAERRRNQLQEFKNQRDQIKENFNQAISEPKQTTQISQNQAQLVAMNQNQLYTNQIDLQEQQNRLLDQTNEQAVILQYQGTSINQTIEQQNTQLGAIGIDMDRTNRNMITTNSKIVKIIQKSSNCWLIIIIVIEIVTFICFLLFL